MPVSLFDRSFKKHGHKSVSLMSDDLKFEVLIQ